MRSTLLALALLFIGPSFRAPAQPPPVAPRTARIFTLKNADAELLRNSVLTIFGRQGITAAADARTNSLLVSGDAETLEAVRKVIEVLDKPKK
jgi:type II secretory pathway component GspD/PulD (secretin)